jgi:sodium/bile acid cotransporter 7
MYVPLNAPLSRLSIAPYVLIFLGTVVFASVLPVRGGGAAIANGVTVAMIALMFFLQGAKLTPGAILAAAQHWRLHTVIFASTFLLFPILGLTARALMTDLLPSTLWTGLLLPCARPSTMLSSIAFTSIARGNVAATLCAATASNLPGIALRSLLAGLLISTNGGSVSRSV